MVKKVEHFAKTLKIKGLGPITIEKLGLSDISDIYEIDEAIMIEKLGSEKVVLKLLAEINRSRNAPLNVLFPAFSIPLVGRTASNKLSKVCKNINEIDEKTCEEAGLGPKVTANLMKWLQTDWSYEHIFLPFHWEFQQAKVSAVTATVCISGKLNSFKTKAIATEALQQAGFSVKTTLTKEVQYLVNESGIESAKTKKARDSGIQIITNLKDFIGE